MHVGEGWKGKEAWFQSIEWNQQYMNQLKNKREYRKNVRTYGVSYSEIKNCEITLMHDDYIPVTFTITPEYIQNITYTGKVKVSGDVILAGRAITEQKPIGDVVVSSGKTTFSAKNGILLAPGFGVKKGASFEAKIEK